MNTHSRVTTLVLVVILALAAMPAHAGGQRSTENADGCASPAPGWEHWFFLPIVGREGENMSDSSASARVAAARRKLGEALGGRFQSRIRFRQAIVDQVEYDNGRLLRATATVDGVSGVPISAGIGDGLQVGNSIELIDWGTPASPDLQFNRLLASRFGNTGVSPGATLATPSGLALTSTWRAANVAAIFASWRALSDMVMGGGYYEVLIKRDDEVDGHVSRCPHYLASTTLDGSATHGDTSVSVISTEGLPAAGPSPTPRLRSCTARSPTRQPGPAGRSSKPTAGLPAAKPARAAARSCAT
jgi:hypothetical protein